MFWVGFFVCFVFGVFFFFVVVAVVFGEWGSVHFTGKCLSAFNKAIKNHHVKHSWVSQSLPD